ncbi:MAG: sensor histidine kinase, partial [Eggerthellaceae bacterium]|nr:sensor histidine kinase [Eggerthellaceae bacterium]
MQQEGPDQQKPFSNLFTLEMIAFTVAVISGMILIGSVVIPYFNLGIMIVAGVTFTLSLAIVVRLIMDPESVRARQSDAMLQLSSQTLESMKDGMTKEAAQSICMLLLPNTAAIAVAITDRDEILGYAGYEEPASRDGEAIRTQATLATIADGEMRVLYTPEEIG